MPWNKNQEKFCRKLSEERIPEWVQSFWNPFSIHITILTGRAGTVYSFVPVSASHQADSGNLTKNLAYLLEVRQMDLPAFRDGVQHEPVDPARFENNLQSRRRSPDPGAAYHSHNWNKPVWKYEVVH